MSMFNDHPKRLQAATAEIPARVDQREYDRMRGRPIGKTIGLFLCSMLLSGSVSGCVALLPWVEPDAQARGNFSDDGCLVSGLRPVVGRSESSPPSVGTVSYLVPRTPVQSGPWAEPIAKRPTPRLAPEVRIQQLIAQLQHREPAMRTHAATDLGAFGSKAAIAVPSLAESIKSDRSEWVRRAAVKSLVKIATPEVINPLKVAQTDRNKWVAHSATNALRKLGYRQEARSKLDRPQSFPQSLPQPFSGTVTAEPVRYRADGGTVKKF